jgi:magnesium transporter
MQPGYELEPIFPHDLRDAWPALSRDERLESFKLVPHVTADEFFQSLSAHEQAELIVSLPPRERRTWIRLLAPDDAADLIQATPPESRGQLLAELDEPTRREVQALMAYAEDEAGGLMNPRFVRVRPEMSIDEALSYARRQTREKAEAVYYAYVLDSAQHLKGVISLRQLLQAPGQKRVDEVMRTDVIAVTEDTDQEHLTKLFAEHKLMAIPVLDAQARMKGVITADDIVNVVQEEATEDIHKVGGMEALDVPYFDTALGTMVRKRGGWLTVLFIGEMLTATAMSYFEEEIARAVVLALFVPLIISSGGNSGSQASTLIIRAMALGEVRLRDWWRVMGREVTAGLALGALLGTIGLLRISVWHLAFGAYGAHWLLVGATVGISLIGVVLWGTLSGSMLPFVLKRAGFDPASASAPFVATLVDVSGLVIYFTVASLTLGPRLF